MTKEQIQELANKCKSQGGTLLLSEHLYQLCQLALASFKMADALDRIQKVSEPVSPRVYYSRDLNGEEVKTTEDGSKFNQALGAAQEIVEQFHKVAGETSS